MAGHRSLRARAIALTIIAVGMSAVSRTFGAADIPAAERPTYVIGDTWVRDDGTYRLTQIDRDRYVFTAGPARTVHLTKDLAIARVERNGTFFEMDPPAKLEWPLKVGRWGTAAATRRSSGNPNGIAVIMTWKIQAIDEIAIAGRTLTAVQIVLTQRVTSTGRETELTTWYSPQTRRLVKAEGSDWETFKFVVTGFDESPATTGQPRTPVPAAPSQPMIVRIAQATGPVETRGKTDPRWIVIHTGGVVADGDEIRTGESATVEIQMSEGGALFLVERSQGALKLERDDTGAMRSVLFHLASGAVRSDVAGSATARLTSVIISSPGGSTAVNGRAVAVVTYDVATRRSVVAALPDSETGAARALVRYIDLAGNGVQMIFPGMFVVHVTGQSPSSPAPLTALPSELKESVQALQRAAPRR